MPSKSQTKYDYKCHYMNLANMLIYHGSELCTAEGPEAVRKLNEQAIAEARKFIDIVSPPKPQTDLSNVKEYRSA
jgi:endonuclease III